MSRINPFMQRRGGALYFRIAVPTDLRPLVGRSEITKTLSSSDSSIAAPGALQLAARVKRAFREIRQDMRFDKSKLDDLMREARERLRLANLTEEHEAEIRELLRQQRLERKLGKIEAENEVLRRIVEAKLAASAPVPSAPAPGPASSAATAAPKAAAKAAAPMPTPSFGEVVQAFLDGFDRRRAGPMFKKHSTVLPLLLKVAGDKPIDELRQSDINRFFDLVCRLPPRWSDACRREKVDPVDLAKRAHPETLGPKTFDDTYKAVVRAFLKVAKRDFQDRGFPVTLTTDGIAYRGSRKPNEGKQRAFTQAELQRLFGGPELAGYRTDPGLEHQFWLPYIGLYTGARVNEICQLNPQCDIAQDERSGIWYFQFAEDSEADSRVAKSIKNAMSVRQVPIHSQLIKLGLLDYVARHKKAGHKLLFPMWKPTRKRASPAAEKWFRQFLKDIGLRDDTPGAKLVGMHAFRHTILNRAYNAQPRLDVTPITGHADDASTVVAGYRGELTLQNKQKVLEAVPFGPLSK